MSIVVSPRNMSFGIRNLLFGLRIIFWVLEGSSWVAISVLGRKTVSPLSCMPTTIENHNVFRVMCTNLIINSNLEYASSSNFPNSVNFKPMQKICLNKIREKLLLKHFCRFSTNQRRSPFRRRLASLYNAIDHSTKEYLRNGLRVCRKLS
jgi:hypothetical protein